MSTEADSTNTEEHSIRMHLRDNQVYTVCDHCNQEFKDEEMTKMTKGKNKHYAYCPECTKVLYPKYRKVQLFNSNPIMSNIMHEALARKEYRR